MGQQQKILVKAQALGARAVTVCGLLAAVSLLNGCGQRGPLFIPNDEEFKQRATLPDIVRRQLPGSTATPAAAPASAPTHTSNMTAPAAPANAASAAGR
jgi:predicted small lipoprotein YifL